MKLSERFINAIDEDSIISGKNAHAIEDVVNFIRKYEDAEEQGRLVILPCKVGDMVYYRRGRDILGDTVERIIIDGLDNQVLVGAHKAYMVCDFGKTVFLTHEEAKTALERIQDEK